jgi:hypothetical protein
MDVKEISDFLEWDDKEREKSSKDNVLGSGSINQSPAKKKNLQSGGS